MDTRPTIREEIRRRSRATGWIGAVVGVGFGIVGTLFGFAAFAVHAQHARLPPRAMLYVMIGLMFLFVIAMNLVRRAAGGATNCPKCAADLRPFAFFMADIPNRKKINLCPYCGISLDDPMPEATAPTEHVTTPDKLVWK